MPNKPKKKTQRRIHFRRCIIIGCGLTSQNTTRDVSFHTLPKATLGWVRLNCAKHLPTGVNLCRVFICSRHYHPSYLNVTPAPGARRLLTTNAIPTIFPPFSGGTSQAENRVDPAPVAERHETDGDSASSTSSDDSDLPIIPPLTAGPVSVSVSEASSSSSSEEHTVSESEEPEEQTTCRPKRSTRLRPPAPSTSTATTVSVVDELRLKIEDISLQCDQVVAVLDKVDHSRIPTELLIPLQKLVEKIRPTYPQRKRAAVEASIEIISEDDIRIREEPSRFNGDDDVNGASTSSTAEHIPVEIHMTTDMRYEGISFRRHRLN